MNKDDKGSEYPSSNVDTSNDSVEVIETVATCAILGARKTKENSKVSKRSIFEMAMDPSIRKMAIDRYQDRNQGGDSPSDFGEHLPIDDLSVTCGVMASEAKPVVGKE